MSATQISFLAFAQQAAMATESTPPVQQAAIAVVAHPLAVGGGECSLSFEGLLPDRRDADWLHLRPEYFDSWDFDSAGCGRMDAPAALPSGSHTGFVLCAGSAIAYVKADGFHGWLRD